MEDRLAKCFSWNAIYQERGINMFHKLFSGRRKFVTLVILVVIFGSVGAWIWAQVGPKTVPFTVTALDAIVSSIKVPINGEWKDTGPIKISLASSATTSYPTGKLDLVSKRATVIWPVSISAPLLKELGLERVDTLLVGVARLVQDSPNTVHMLTADFAVLDIPISGIPLMVVFNVNNNKKYCRPAALGPGAELSGTFELTEECFRRGVDFRSLAQEAFTMASQFMHFPIEDVDTFLDTVVNLSRQKLHEIVVYIPKFNSYQTADLKGTDTLRVGR